MKQEAELEARIALLESENLRLNSEIFRWQSDHATISDKLLLTEGKLHQALDQRNHFMKEAAELSISHQTALNEGKELRIAISDLRQPLNHQKNDAPLEGISAHSDATSGPKPQSAASRREQVIIIDSDSEGYVKTDVPRTYTIPDGKTSTPPSSIGSRRSRAKFDGVELGATALLKKRSVNDEISSTSFDKSSADHPSPRKKPRIREGRKRSFYSALEEHMSSTAHQSSHSPLSTVADCSRHAADSPSISRRSSMSELTSLPHDAEDPMSEDMAKDGVTNLEQAVQAPNPSSVPLSIFIGKRDSIGDQSNLPMRTKYLLGIPKFNIDPAPSTTRVTRQFLSTTYGGHAQQLIQHMNFSRSKENPTLYPDRDYNSYLPSSPGLPGLMFTARRDILEHPSWRLFIRSTQRLDGRIVYDYYGLYTTSLLGYLTRLQFRNLSQKVQENLTSTVYKRMYPECKAMRARILFRKRGKLPDEPSAIEEVIKKEVDGNPCKYEDTLKQQDVLDAFLRGDEIFQVILMQCVGYEHEFMSELTEKFPKFDHTAKSKS